ncbi:MAG TPA: TonB-dependent receptor [Burkholderiaceae bacterium]|nr:TonB-dependent receptor [Burkholderiaceae bacterium]
MFKQKPIVRSLALAFGGAASLLTGATLAQDKPQVGETITITGTRIPRQFISVTPTVQVTAEELTANQDITVETFLNTLPQVNPAATTTSNNPGNDGQAVIDLRGLGPNRNLVLIDGRRPMVSNADQSVDVNTIPAALVENIEVISGGAGAVYGADAVAGVVNFRLKRRFEGLDFRAGIQDSTEFWDAKEKNVSGVIGGNFGRGGNAAMAFEYADREPLIKSQRQFAKVATATTSFFPEGTYRPSGTNLPSQAAVDALYGQASYGGAPAGSVPRTLPHGFNADGTLFSPGIFNSPADVRNFRYPIDDAVNTNLFPDVYSYNFDAVNLLVLPLERRSMMAKFDYRFANDVEVFARFSNARYNATSALAPTPVSTVTVAAADAAGSGDAVSAFVEPGRNVGAQLVVPATNPFIPADLAALLASRTGDDPRLVGTGAGEAFTMRWRTVQSGLRTQTFDNNVTQYLGGAKVPLIGSWNLEAYLSEGRTRIDQTQGGNIDTQRLQQALEAADGGASLCAGGVNPFGRQPLSAECVQFLAAKVQTSTAFTQTIGQAFATGEVFPMPGGAATAVIGAEQRRFEYAFDPGAASGPISGFNVETPAGGTNSFRDFFGELALPILRDRPFAREVDVNLAYRHSTSESKDEITQLESPSQSDNAWAITFNWAATQALRARASVQRSVRAPNFGELFDGGGSAPQIFDPCSVTSTARTSGANAAQLRTLCQNAGIIGGLGAAVDTFVQTPGTQASIDFVGNRNLEPETGTSYTIGLVFAPQLPGALSGLRGSLDYYNIRVKNAIVAADSNEFIADCYNYYGNNPTYDPNHLSCQSLFRAGDILGILDPNDPDGFFTASNQGNIETDGLDAQIAWGMPIGPGRFDTLLNAHYLLHYKLKTANQFPENDFAGTIPYFGAALSFTSFSGQAFPKWRVNWTARYKLNGVAADVRMRYIDKMDNRMSKIFPGETEFTGVKSTTYWDAGVSWEFLKGMTIRAGINNIFDQEPRTYQPNVQSGTDPSTYDVIGRRYFLQALLRFQ